MLLARRVRGCFPAIHANGKISNRNSRALRAPKSTVFLVPVSATLFAQFLLSPADTVFSDALNHGSLIGRHPPVWRGEIIYPHCDLEFLERVLHDKHADRSSARVIVTESVFSMEGDIAPITPCWNWHGSTAPNCDEKRMRPECAATGRGSCRPWLDAKCSPSCTLAARH